MSDETRDEGMDDGTGPGTEQGAGDPEVGSVGEEAAKLFGVLSDWARDNGVHTGTGAASGDGLAGLAGQAAEAVRGIDEHVATGAAECRWCPVCRTVHAVRQCTPEVRDQLATAAAHLMQAAAGLLVAAAPPRGREGSARGDHVQRIDLDHDPGDPGSGDDA